MIQRMSHTVIYVNDQEKARQFYIDKLGFEVRMDASLEGFRWLTVAPKGQPDLEIVLMPTEHAQVDEASSKMLRELVSKGALGAGVFHTADCRKTHEELAAKGVEFTQPPEDRPYGVEAVFKDDSGNWFSLTEPKFQP